ncbi:unnamed protein product [Microthlaspi erraticum]|uniref:Uncharacterized protein n=1 Tax=Microthlaspi erraticum TaxID=1685480 RepID=A0A6D2KXK9_9BRAS|nr:unnamed protein product [Microthlaspi erraticum]CAA7046376.1 unnamed protein product [Microthlaspi erraticum]CAA7046818.1 unnamed protein product [Microthlaspi erraticum]CAA7057236.1 unnamed protein product [Microthlaspi erraticum]
MASNACKLLCLVLSLAFVTQLEGYGDCQLSDIIVKQSRTGKLVQNKPEWEMKVTNLCSCKVKNVKLSCAGFSSVTRVDLYLLKVRDVCLLRSGTYAYPHSDIVFTYVRDTIYDFKVLSADLCVAT